LLIVVGIIGLLLVLIGPAFTTIKGGTDVTSSAYTIKGVLDTARTYAMANNTYTWVGFCEEDVSSTTSGCGGTGRIVMSIVASKDGTKTYTDPPTTSVTLDPAGLVQVGKLTKIENSHLKTFTDGSGIGDTFDTRPLVGTAPPQDLDARIGDTTPIRPPQSPGLQSCQFQYPVGSSLPPVQYNFTKIIQFSPSGDARVANNSYSVKTVVEVGIQPTHGTTPDNNSTNLAAVQLTGFGGSVKIYRR
jgi:Tfp pilus assembly protein FimT